MGTSEHIVKTSLELIASCEKKAKVVMEFIKGAACLIEEYRNEQEGMISALKEKLARTSGLRRRDFDDLINGVLARRKEMEKGIKESLESLWMEEGEMVNFLRAVITTEKTDNLEMLKKVRLPLLQKKEGDAAKLLMGLRLEQAELGSALKQLLSKGERVRVRDFKAMVKTVKMRQRERGKGIGRLLDEFDTARVDVMAEWKAVFSAYENHGLSSGGR